MLVDGLGRRVDYLRLSVTDRCDLRCSYCMPEGYKGYEEPEHWLSFGELDGLLAVFARLGLKLAWSDRTANTAIKDTTAFVDGAAVQFPVNGKASTTPFMGDAKNPVDVWHWRADGRTESLVAHGFGSATRLPFEGLKSAAVRTGDGWAVVLSRPLKVKPGEGASLQGRGSVPVAFAAWDGDNQERDGLKAVTLEWWQLKF